MHVALSPTAFAAHVASNRVLDAPVGSLALDDIATRIRRMTDRFVAEDMIFSRARTKAIVSGARCIWIADGNGGAFEPLAGMTDGEIDRLVGGGK